ncbi:MAG: SDR family NAD(P)-dependent oxidoreductase [Acidobacteria bacterium]|nr:SDR family NAD(P)-dependent oxidoreductase [Acidobacteriota bacterium]MCB9396591.1 SDR family NAD(P)-dependent oxidoreductase [Acidobacteriota bacterium]
MHNQKVILITGASSGMGKVTAQALIQTGHIVYAAARTVENMKDLAIAGGHIIQMDVAKSDEAARAVEQVLAEQGRIDVLWNNAGFGLYGPVEEVDLDKARYQFEVNLFGLAAMTQAVLPHMRAQRAGLIINTSSMGGKIYTPLGAWYHATKHALEGWSDCLRLELKEFGIKVVILEPGLIETGFADGVKHHFAPEAAHGPYQRMVKALLKSAENGSLKGSDPSLIAKTIQKIIQAKNPKTRYLVGAMAKPLVAIRYLCGDRIYDKLILSQVK